jgi:hypothetical protein
MRFDTALALEWAGTFAFFRGAGTTGERKAGEIVADELARLGLRVERVEVRGSRLPGLAVPWLGWLGVGAWAAGLVWAAHRGVHWPVRLALALAALLWLRLTAVEGFPFRGTLLRRVSTMNVVAWREGHSEPPPLRVVFHTTLDTFDVGRELVSPCLATPVIAGLLAALIFCEMTINRNPMRLPSWCWLWMGLLLLLLLWLAIGTRTARLVMRTGRPDVRDNRTGLALLLELARGWPRTTEGRIESRFVATGGRTLDRAGLRALVSAIGNEWPAKPTLIVDWLAPGIGPGLALVEQGTETLADTAAKDLWIPHRSIHRALLGRQHWPLGRHGPAYIGLVGDGVNAHSAPVDSFSIDADALGRAAQLATEVTLRWAKRKQQPDEEAVPRS